MNLIINNRDSYNKFQPNTLILYQFDYQDF